MGKKSNSGGQGQSGKPISVPNKEIIQRMNFLHQAAVLVSGALYTPTPSTSKVTQDPASLAQERKKRTSTSMRAHHMENAGQFMSTQAGEEPMAPDASALPAETEDAAVLAHRKAFKDAKQAQMDKKRRAEDTRLFVLYLEHQGATPEEIKVKLNKRKKSFRRKQAKANMAPLEFGTAFYKHQEEDNGITSISKRTAKRRRLNLPLHPSQVEHRNLACHYVNDIRTMAKKNVLRMDPAIKRTFCRNCNALLIAGLTSNIKILPSPTHVHVMRTTCLACNVSRTIPCPPLHKVGAMQTTEDVTISEESSMQEDTTPFSASTSTSHTLSEHSPNVEDVIAANTDPKEAIGGASIAQIDMDGQPLISRKERTAKQPSDKRTKQKRKQNKQRKTPHADPVVPGKKGQYVHLRFHERPEHTITEINKPPPPTS